MATPAFASAMDALTTLASSKRVAVMCAEALWWQCHRRLIADWLVARGYDVVHIESATRASPHRLIEPARLIDGRLSYAAEQTDLGV